MTANMQSNYVFCGCGKPSQTAATLQTAGSKTDEDAHKEAKKYVNDEIPAYNKLFIGTILLVGLLIYSDGKRGT